nr:PREDICTED: uncharacterized protein LOC104145666 isoform X2 [Struthio camelus australis]
MTECFHWSPLPVKAIVNIRDKSELLSATFRSVFSLTSLAALQEQAWGTLVAKLQNNYSHTSQFLSQALGYLQGPDIVMRDVAGMLIISPPFLWLRSCCSSIKRNKSL